MFKTDWKQDNIVFYRAKEAEKLIGFAKTHDELIIDFGGQKRNQIYTTVFHSCTITANIWENSKKLKRRTHVKSNLKTS